MTPDDAVHGDEPDSKPALPTTWAGVQAAAVDALADADPGMVSEAAARDRTRNDLSSIK